MSSSTTEINRFQDMGQRLNTWGKYQIASFVLVFVGSIVFLQSIIANINSTSQSSDVMNQFATSLVNFSYFATAVVLVEYYLIYKLATSVKAETTDVMQIDTSNSSGNYFILHVISGIVIAILSLLNTIQLANTLRNSSNLSYAELSQTISTAENGSNIILLLGIIPAVLLVLAMNKLVQYLDQIMNQQRTFDLQEGRDKINTAKNGSILLVLSKIVSLTAVALISGLLSLIGAIMLIYGIIKGGTLLKNYGNLQYGGMTPYTYPTRHPSDNSVTPNYSSPTSLTPPLETIQNGIFCSNCGTKNAADAKFCTSCGTQMQAMK